jgi:ribosomal protein S18 acetylase RimI-like enzyme
LTESIAVGSPAPVAEEHSGDYWVRPADLSDPSDAAAVVALLDAYARDPMGDAQGLPQAAQEALIPGLRAFPGCLVLLAGRGTDAVGLAVCFPGFSTFRARPILNIHDLAVLPAHRGQGVGTMLLAAVEAEARRRGCCKLTLEVRGDNPPARSLYARCGFGPGSSAGEPVQSLFLEKRLA